MKRRELSLTYFAILGIVIAGLYTFGAPTSTLVYMVLALACPPLMIFIPGSRVTTKGVATESRNQHIATGRW
jgi:hypothetical protein